MIQSVTLGWCTLGPQLQDMCRGIWREYVISGWSHRPWFHHEPPVWKWVRMKENSGGIVRKNGWGQKSVWFESGDHSGDYFRRSLQGIILGDHFGCLFRDRWKKRWSGRTLWSPMITKVGNGLGQAISWSMNSDWFGRNYVMLCQWGTPNKWRRFTGIRFLSSENWISNTEFGKLSSDWI